MRLGLVAWGTPTGLGYQTAAIHRHLHPAKTLLIDISARKRMPLHREWFPGPGTRIVEGTPRPPADEVLLDFLQGLDVVFACETPLWWRIFELARAHRVRSVLQYNLEFLDHLQDPSLPAPTVFASPSPWRVEELAGGPFRRVWSLPVPVDPEGLPDRKVERARTFVHIAGRPAMFDRSGALDFIEAAHRCRDLRDARWLLMCQQPGSDITGRLRQLRARHVKLIPDQPDRATLYRHADVLVRPRRYGGLDLPLQEAMACGVPSLMTAVDPQIRWLPSHWLVPATVRQTFQARTEIQVHQVDVPQLCARIRRLHGDPALVQRMAQEARDLAAGLTWEAMLPTYRAFLDRVMAEEP